jgi:hypothetical protein
MQARARAAWTSAFFWIVVALALALVAGSALVGALANLLFLLPWLLLVAMVVSRIAGAFRKSLVLGFARRPAAREHRKHLLQFLNIAVFLGLTATALLLAIVPLQFRPDEVRSLWLATGGGIVALLVLALVPQRKVRASTNLFFVVVSLFLCVELARILLPPAPADATELDSPFHGEWSVFHGGRSSLVNHHYPIAAQRHALDLVVTRSGREVDGDPGRLAADPCFGATLFAPSAGRVVVAVTDLPDLPVGAADRERIAGNHLVLDLGGGRFLLMAHLKQGSARVGAGDAVRAGQAIAECGNSGNTSQPHLHLQVQSGPNFLAPGVRTFPILFRDVERRRGGRQERVRGADLRRNDLVSTPE